MPKGEKWKKREKKGLAHFCDINAWPEMALNVKQ